LNNSTFLSGEDIPVTPKLLRQLLNRASRFGSCCFLDNRHYESPLHAHEFLLGAGVVAELVLNKGEEIEKADNFLASSKGRWVFGHLSYELMHGNHGLNSSKEERTGFPLLYLFVPQVVFKFNGRQVAIRVQDESLNAKALWQEVLAMPDYPAVFAPVSLQSRITRDDYISIINQLKNHIQRGDCYEINFCQEFYNDVAEVQPLDIYHALATASPNPFSCYYKYREAHLMCASPERYLTKRGNKVFSQPIKGTAPRSPGDEIADEAARQNLRTSKKDLSENVMVVDLVRNDLSIICEQGSVMVDELFGIYSYPQVHQMISTISGTLRKDITFSEILKSTFPMGSMTGAPKHRVMQLIDQYESSGRGLFSGAVGYFDPEGDFDFNVVIRSILYNEKSKYLNYFVGGGITWYSKAEEEYEECLWKAEAIRKVLGGLLPD
jgi:para-aminobenzoate synthetase component I